VLLCRMEDDYGVSFTVCQNDSTDSKNEFAMLGL
jgi:hypothetical protein